MKAKRLSGRFAWVVLLAVLVFGSLTPAAAAVTFYNPIVSSGADPSVVFSNGYYYLVQSDGNIHVTKSPTLTGLANGTSVTVWTHPATGAYCCEVWGPELLFINNKFYIYFAADDGNNSNHRMYVLESNTLDPQGAYTFRGKLTVPTDRWAIDGSVLQQGTSLYFIWSGWAGTTNVQQNLYIAPMSNPYTISGDRVLISSPTNVWERNGGSPYINEGPEALVRNNKVFVVYSASGSWSDDYCLGMLTASSTANLLLASSWTKSNGCVFSKAPTAYGPGHNSFTKSYDGTEDWLVYHANTVAGSGWNGRSIRAQKFTWNSDGSPNFGTPAATSTALVVPSGEAFGWGDSASGTPASGLWSITSAANANSASLGAGWHELFRGNLNQTSYTVQAEAQWVQTGSSTYPKYGIYATYKDSGNFVAAFLDKKFGVLATYGVVGGVAQTWQNTALSIDFTQYHTLKVVKSGSTFTFYVDNVLKQTRTFAVSNGQVGLVTEDTRANYRNVSVQ